MASSTSADEHRSFASLLGLEKEPSSRRLAVLLLNSPDEVDRRLTTALLESASIVITGDGGLDRFRWALDGASAWHKVLATVGDFDSVGDGRSAGGGMTLHMPSQEANDMFKCLAVLRCASESTGGAEALEPAALIGRASDALGVACETDASRCGGAADASLTGPLAGGAGGIDVVVLGGMGGRFDHEAQSLNALVCWTSVFRSMWLIGSHSHVSLAPAGDTRVRLTPPLDGPTCGVIPVGTPPDRVSTTGLRWNLGPDIRLAYGSCVSSSNHAEQAEVGISTDRPVLFTASIDAGAVHDAVEAAAGRAGGPTAAEGPGASAV